MNRLFRYHAIFTQFLQRPSRIPILAIDARLCLFHPRVDEARVPPEQRTGLSECPTVELVVFPTWPKLSRFSNFIAISFTSAGWPIMVKPGPVNSLRIASLCSALAPESM